MRLIDADKLETTAVLGVQLQHADSRYYYFYEEETIEKAPTVKAIPIEWLKQKANDLAYAYWHGVKNKLTLPMKDLPLVIETMVQYWEKENEQIYY